MEVKYGINFFQVDMVDIRFMGSSQAYRDAHAIPQTYTKEIGFEGGSNPNTQTYGYVMPGGANTGSNAFYGVPTLEYHRDRSAEFDITVRTTQGSQTFAVTLQDKTELQAFVESFEAAFPSANIINRPYFHGYQLR